MNEYVNLENIEATSDGNILALCVYERTNHKHFLRSKKSHNIREMHFTLYENALHQSYQNKCVLFVHLNFIPGAKLMNELNQDVEQ